MRHLSPALCLLLLSVSACVPAAAPEPELAAAPSPPPAPPVQPPPALSPDWRDWPVAEGDWVYRQDERGSAALFGVPNSDAVFATRCDKASGRIQVSRAGSVGATGGQMTIRTSFGATVWPVRATGGALPYMVAEVASADAGLDRMAFSRGRFAIEVTGLPQLAIPAGPEFVRVVEDCRG